MKTLDEFVALFAEQLDETDPSTVTAQTKFRDLEEWSSLLALTLISMIDEEYGHLLTGADLRARNTVKELYDYVESL